MAVFFFFKIALALLRESIFIGVTPNNFNCSHAIDLLSTEDIEKEIEKFIHSDNAAAIVSVVLVLLLPMLLIVALAIAALTTLIKNKNREDDDSSIEHSLLLTIFTCKVRKNFSKHTKGSAAVCLLQCLALFFYCYDDTVEFVIHRYHDNLKCGKSCVDANLTIARIASVLAATLLHFFPLSLAAINWKIDNDHFKKEILNNALRFFAYILKIEATYNAFSIAIQYQSYCDTTEQVLGWIMLTACAIFGSLLIFTKFFNKLAGANCVEIIAKLVVFTLVFVLTFSFLASDTQQPLGCAFGCDLSHINSTRAMLNLIKVDDTHCCRVRLHAVIRLTLTILALIITLAIPTSEYLLDKAVDRYSKWKDRVRPLKSQSEQQQSHYTT